jgi:hypothetical protein
LYCGDEIVVETSLFELFTSSLVKTSIMCKIVERPYKNLVSTKHSLAPEIAFFEIVVLV